MTIIVGRGRSKATQRIEITDPTVSREHCWLTDNGDGTYTLQNKSLQGTFVNGRQVVKTVVKADDKITISASTTVKVADLLPLKQPAQGGKTVEEYSIAHLKDVWDEYHDTLLDIQVKQRKLNMYRSASPMFTIGSGAIATLAKTMGWSDAIFVITLAMTAIGLMLMVFCFVNGFRDNSIEKREAATEKFNSEYVCPNPKCHHFMGAQSYHIIRQNKNCPWCKCKFTTSK